MDLIVKTVRFFVVGRKVKRLNVDYTSLYIGGENCLYRKIIL